MKCSEARGDRESAETGKLGRDVLGNAIGNVLLARIATQVVERKYSDGRLVGGDLLDPWHWRGIGGNFEYAHRPIDVLKQLFAQVFVGKFEPVAEMVADRAGNRDAAWRGYALKPGRHIDAITEDILSLDDHIPKIDPNPELNDPLFRQIGVAQRHSLLNVHSTGNRIHHAGELRQKAVSRGLEYSALVFADPGIEEFAAELP